MELSSWAKTGFARARSTTTPVLAGANVATSRTPLRKRGCQATWTGMFSNAVSERTLPGNKSVTTLPYSTETVC